MDDNPDDSFETEENFYMVLNISKSVSFCIKSVNL